jgi:hypothetical protein
VELLDTYLVDIQVVVAFVVDMDTSAAAVADTSALVVVDTSAVAVETAQEDMAMELVVDTQVVGNTVVGI